MTNKLVVIIKSLKVPKIKKILLYEMKFLVPNYSCLQNPWIGGGYCPQDPRSLCPLSSTEFVEPPPHLQQNSWVRYSFCVNCRMYSKLMRRLPSFYLIWRRIFHSIYEQKVEILCYGVTKTCITLATRLTFRHRASCILGQTFHYSPENAFYIFNQQIYFIIWYLLDRASLI